MSTLLAVSVCANLDLLYLHNQTCLRLDTLYTCNLTIQGIDILKALLYNGKFFGVIDFEQLCTN